MVTIVGSRPAKYVALGGGLPVLAITVNAENARRVSWPESLTEVHSRHEVLTSVEAVGVQGCTTSRHLYCSLGRGGMDESTTCIGVTCCGEIVTKIAKPVERARYLWMDGSAPPLFSTRWKATN